MSPVSQLAARSRMSRMSGYRWAYLDPASKREVRRALLKAICVPGHLTPFESREMPVARGWGSGGLQVTLAAVVDTDIVKVIDQGDDNSLNALAMRDLVSRTTDVRTTTDAREASLIQTRHRIPEDALAKDAVIVFQVPVSDPLRWAEPRTSVTRALHADKDYAAIWLALYEEYVRFGEPSQNSAYPCEVEGGYVITPSPIPRYDVLRLDRAPFLALFGAGREAVVYAIPPYTSVKPIAFDDKPFAVESFTEPCGRCGASNTYLVEATADGASFLVCSDTARCERRQRELAGVTAPGWSG